MAAAAAYKIQRRAGHLDHYLEVDIHRSEFFAAMNGAYGMSLKDLQQFGRDVREEADPYPRIKSDVEQRLKKLEDL